MTREKEAREAGNRVANAATESQLYRQKSNDTRTQIDAWMARHPNLLAMA